MSVDLRDYDALRAVSPAALVAYASTAGWNKAEAFGDHADVYVADGKPEVILPRTEHLGDYPRVVSQLIGIFAKDAEWDELSIYRTLVTADRDVVQVRVAANDDGSLTLNEGASLIGGAREMILSAACSLHDPRPLYRAGANKEANDLLNQVRLGQTDQGSFVVNLLTPLVQPAMRTLFPDADDQDDQGAPVHRKVTRRLHEALTAAKEAMGQTVAGDASAFAGAVQHGVNANLCDALVRLIEPFSLLDVRIAWARTRPLPAVETATFAKSDAPLLKEAARLMRVRAPRPDVRLHAFVTRLNRGEADDTGTVGLVASIDGKKQSVVAMLDQFDYKRAIQAHEEKAFVVLEGDLDRLGQRWRLLNPRIADVITNRAPDSD